MTPEELHLRDEILQVMFWLRGEGFGKHTSAAQLCPFLPAEQAAMQRALLRMMSDGLVASLDRESFELTELGLSEGGRRFTEEFADAGLGAGGHGKCAPGCDCELHGPHECSQHQH